MTHPVAVACILAEMRLDLNTHGCTAARRHRRYTCHLSGHRTTFGTTVAWWWKGYQIRETELPR
ncbi:hypothetical protein ACNKHW_23160 [Shigella flexneri]